MTQPTYKEAEKGRVREMAWSKAVTALTGSASGRTIVRLSELRETVEYSLSVLRATESMRSQVREELEQWTPLYQQHTKPIKAHNLKVLYLCGPEPLNDLSVMQAHGINPHNVWAVEGSKAEFKAAISQIHEARIPLQIHHGALREFLNCYKDTFHII